MAAGAGTHTYDREQLKIVRNIQHNARRRYKDPKLRKRRVLSAISVGLVESDLHNLSHGDADSVNYRQERKSIYGGDMNLDRITNRLFDEMDQLDTGQSKGELAADVQRPREDLRGKYRARMGEAKQLRQIAGKGPKGGPAATLRGRIGKIEPGSRPKIIPGGTTVDKRGALLAALMSGEGGSLLKRWQGEIATGAFTTTTKPRIVKGKGDKYVGGKPVTATVPADAKDPTGKAGTIHELFWNGPGARNIKEGKRVPKGFVDGHKDHVHLAADRATMKRAAALAKSMGLTVSEYGKGITTGHAADSWHYKPFGAMDVSGARMAEFARRIARGDY